MLSFIHIPKTGGSTLRWILDRVYARFHYVIEPWFDAGAASPLRAVAPPSRADAVGAHRPLAPGSWPEGPAIAMLRDPVRRVLSHAAHVRAEPEAWLPEPAPELDLPLADWIERRPLALFDNNQVRYLSGATEFDGMPMMRTMAESDLERALEAIRTHVLAAPMEAFDEALILWRDRFGWRNPYHRRINVRATGRVEPSERDVKTVRAWNRLDATLWEEARVLFRQRVQEFERSGRILDQEVLEFRSRNDTALVQAGLLAHTARRGLRHPVRAARSVVGAVRRRIS